MGSAVAPSDLVQTASSLDKATTVNTNPQTESPKFEKSCQLSTECATNVSVAAMCAHDSAAKRESEKRRREDDQTTTRE